MRTLVAAGCVLLVAACHDGSVTPPATPPAALAVVRGDAQSAAVGTQLPVPLTVRVTDAAGAAVSGAAVVWTVPAGSGTLDAAATRTDAAGESSVRWTLPGTDGQWAVTATVQGVNPVTFHGTAHGPLTVRILEPAAGDTVDSLHVSAQVRGTTPVATVVATAGGVRLPLALAGIADDSTFIYAGSAAVSGAALQLRLDAADSAGHTAMATTPFFHDAPPQVQLGAPFTGAQPPLLSGSFHLVASCSDDDGGCRSLQVLLNGRVVASGRQGVDTTVSLQGFTGFATTLRLAATGAHGVADTVASPLLVVRPDTTWAYLGHVDGSVLDSDGRRAIEYLALFNQTDLDALTTGGRTHLIGNLGGPDVAHVTAAGAIIESFGGSHPFQGVLMVGGSYGHGAFSCCVQAQDAWVAWRDDGAFLHRENVLTGAVNQSLRRDGMPFWLGDDGSVAYVDTASGGSRQLFVLRPDDARDQVTSNPAATTILWGSADGGLVLYARQSGAQQQVVLLDAGGEHVLTAPGDVPSAAPGVLRDGWAAWTLLAGGSTQVWTRSPAGEVRRADGGLAVVRWSLGWSGKLVLDDGSRVYLAAPPYTTRVDLGQAQYRSWLSWHNGQLYAFPANAIFRIDR